jgi:predicted nucleotidyltransferase
VSDGQPPIALPAEVVAALERFRSGLAERFGDRLALVRLYGSYARGEAWEESDVDVLVLVEDVTADERDEVIGLAWRSGDVGPDAWVVLSPLVKAPRELDELRRRERAIARAIDREGITL